MPEGRRNSADGDDVQCCRWVCQGMLTLSNFNWNQVFSTVRFCCDTILQSQGVCSCGMYIDRPCYCRLVVLKSFGQKNQKS